MDYQNKFNKTNKIYKISSEINLDSSTLKFPDNSIIDFSGGNISNGTVDLNSAYLTGYVNFGTNVTYVGNSRNVLNNMKRCVGDTDERPSLLEVNRGFQYFDTTINKPIWWTGTEWVDSSGVIM